MIRLSLLGTAELQAADGADLVEVLRQSKRLALLAYLATDEPVRFHRRDSLLALFWPELDDAHARAALRRALHFLRRHLGEEAVVSRGDELGARADAVWCDVAAFREALAASRSEDALQLYRGDLLAGVFVPSAPEFERWLEGERGRLRLTAARTARTLCERDEAAGSLETAVAWAKRALGLAPDDEAAIHLLLTLLERAGDRPAALRAYDGFVRRLADDFGLEPSEETVALVERVRSSRRVNERPAPGRGGSPVERPPNPNIIAVLPFSVRGPEEVTYLREGMVDLLSAKLDGAGELRTVDPHALLRRLHGDEAPIGPDKGKELATRFGAGAFLLGSIVVAGDRIQLTATLYELHGDRAVRVDTEAKRESGVFEIVDDLVRRLLAARITSLGGQIGRLAAMTTTSLPALKAYLAGERAFRLGQYLESSRFYEQAVGVDETFALGQYRLASALAASGMPDGAREVTQRASAHRERLAPHARLLVEAQAAWLGSSPQDAEALYVRLLAARPDSVEGWFLLGNLQFDLNPYLGRSATEARLALARAVKYDPRHVAALAHLARIAALEGDRDQATALIDRHVALSPGGDQALSMVGMRAFLLDDAERCRQFTASLASAPAVVLATAFSDIALYATDARTAGDLAGSLAESLPGDAMRAVAHAVVGHLALAGGDVESALRAARDAERLDRPIGLEHRGLFLTLPFVDYPTSELEQGREALEQWDAPAGPFPARPNLAVAIHDGLHAHLREYLLGLLAARLGDRDAALRHADTCEVVPASAAAGAMPRNLAAGVRARVAMEAGDAESALAELEKVRLEGWFEFALVSPFFGLAAERFLRARALQALGRTKEARHWLTGLAQRSLYELIYREEARRLIAELAPEH